ncbi:MAG TPA: HAD hydrolase family protein [Burkholderiales bacterium]|nr:HAD hydrolase family protein [Burkholderiales bacterium]
MIKIDVPGFGPLQLEHLVLDFNGTLAVDGALLPGVAERLGALGSRLSIHVLTADTHGTAARALAGVACSLVVAPASGQAEAKRRFVEALGAERVVAIGNGRNDRLMLEAARVGIAVVQAEGASAQALAAADLVVPTIADALDLLAHPLRLVATLRD